MKKLTNKTNITIRAAMILLLSATAATPRSVYYPSGQSHSGAGTNSHSNTGRGGNPGNQGHNRPANQGLSRPSNQGHNRPTNQGFTRPSNQGHNRPTNQGFTRPSNQGHNRPTNQGFTRPSNQGHNRPVNQGYNRPSSMHGNPGSYGHGGYNRHERPISERHVRGGYVQRTFVHGGRSVASYYRPFHYRGYQFHAYAPARFFSPRFYGWADSAWAYRVHYRWSWYASPWYTAYRSYFTPYAVYTSAPFWLTDYVLASSLQESWQEGAAGCGCSVGLTPSVKQMIAMEVRRQIVQERAEATGYQASTPTFLDGNAHVMVVSNGTMASANGQACSLSGGDVVQIDGNSQVDANSATVQVVASKAQDCAMGSYVTVALDQLQDMQNQMRQSIDQGMETLRAQQGQNGLPALPADAMSMASAGYSVQ